MFLSLQTRVSGTKVQQVRSEVVEAGWWTCRFVGRDAVESGDGMLGADLDLTFPFSAERDPTCSKSLGTWCLPGRSYYFEANEPNPSSPLQTEDYLRASNEVKFNFSLFNQCRSGVGA